MMLVFALSASGAYTFLRGVSMLRRSLLVSLMMGAMAWGNAYAQSVEVAGVKFEPTVNVGGNTVQLNGAGIRYKAIFKVYAAGLYLPKKTKVISEALAMPGAKRITVTMLRDIDANELGRLFSRAIEDEIPKQDYVKVLPDVLRMSQIFTDYKSLKSGDTFTLDWVPGSGTVISIKGKAFGEAFKEPEFYHALMSIWLGKTPPDYKLKEAMMRGE
jgi:Chalcone isomerase-like